MRAREWLLLMLDSGLDPIRIQKGMFLFAMESGRPAAELYTFEPYNWGPLSVRIYRDLDRLQGEGLVERSPVPGTTYARYRRTEAGAAAARTLEHRANQEGVARLLSLREFVERRSLNALLRDVYERYPDYATKSMFRF